MARIGIDARKYFDFGIGTYIQQLVQAFGERASIHNIVLFVAPEESNAIQLPDGMSKVPVDYAKYSIREYVSYGRRVRSEHIELFHEPHYTLPAGLKGRSVVTIHDLIHLKFPQYFNAVQRAYARFMIRHAVNDSGAVIAVSQRTKEDIVERLRISDERIHVIYNGVHRKFRKVDDSRALEQRKQRFRLERPFVLYVGGQKPHKNIGVLLKAFQEAQESFPDLELVFVGERLSEHKALADQARSLGIDSKVKDIGRLHGDELVYLYNLAQVLVIPSLYEGFGLPALEAMACGTPVVVSDRGSLPEIAGNGALVFEAHRADALADTLRQVFNDSTLRAGLIERGLKQAERFSWNITAEQTLRVYESVISSKY